MSFLDRTKLLIGDKNIAKLCDAKVIVFGVGGVGGYVVEMLARAGVGSITIVDFDRVDETNINRQIIALHSTIGCPKTDLFKARIEDINPDIKVNAICDKVCKENIDKFNLTDYDYVVDAIDIVTDKVELIKSCHSLGVEIISAMGAGNRFCTPDFKCCDIYDTYNDGLAKILRKRLREEGITHHKVVFTPQDSTPNGRVVGSISYYPAMCGCVIASVVINDIINK